MRTFIFVLLPFLLFGPSALTKDCERAVELYNRGTLAKDFKEKEKIFKEALSLPCTDKWILAKIYNNLADTYEQLDRFEEAIAGYNKAIGLDPELATPYTSLGDIYTRIGRPKEAEKYYGKAFFLKNYRSRDELIEALNPKRALGPVPSVSLYFGFDEAILTEEGERQLKALLEALSDNELRSFRFRLAGHTCSIGPYGYNQGLSQRRSNAVKEWLVDHDIPEDYLKTMGLGEERPIGDNNAEEGRRLNRRVEIRTVGVVVSAARSTNKSMKGMRLLEEGERLFVEERYQEAASIFEDALEVFKEDAFTEGIRAAWGNLLLVYRFLGDEKKASFYLERFEETER